MPRYYFDIEYSGHRNPDSEGTLVRDDAAAIQLARFVADGLEWEQREQGRSVFPVYHVTVWSSDRRLIGTVVTGQQRAQMGRPKRVA